MTKLSDIAGRALGQLTEREQQVLRERFPPEFHARLLAKLAARRKGIEMQKPTVGRIVMFGMGTTDGGVVARPAIVVRVIDDSPHDAVNLQVFTDAEDGDGDRAEAAVHAANVVRSPSGALERGCWSWPERAPAERGDASGRAELLANARALVDTHDAATLEGARLQEALRYILRALA